MNEIYWTGILFGAKGLEESASTFSSSQAFLSSLTTSMNKQLSLKRTGMLYYDKHKIKKVRSANVVGGNFIGQLPDIKETSEIGLFWFDADFSDEKPPQIFFNIHLSRRGTINGTKLVSECWKGPINTFVLVSVLRQRLSSPAIEQLLVSAFQKLFWQLGGIKGGVVGNAPRGLGCGCDFGWAYKNLSAQLARKTVEALPVQFDIEFNPKL